MPTGYGINQYGSPYSSVQAGRDSTQNGFSNSSANKKFLEARVLEYNPDNYAVTKWEYVGPDEGYSKYGRKTEAQNPIFPEDMYNFTPPVVGEKIRLIPQQSSGLDTPLYKYKLIPVWDNLNNNISLPPNKTKNPLDPKNQTPKNYNQKLNGF